MPDTATQRLLDALTTATGHTPRPAGRGYTTRCPGPIHTHGDREPSLSVTPIEGSVLIHCHAGCTTDQILHAIGWHPRDLYDNPRDITYRYDSGLLVHRRYADDSTRKTFRQSGNKTKQTELYHLSRLQKATEGAIFLVEGEKDVLALESAGHIATTAPMGAANFDKVDITPLAGRTIIAIVDRDESGDRWAALVQSKVAPVAAALRFAHPGAGKDAADHIAAGLDTKDLIPYTPPTPGPGRAATATTTRAVTISDISDRDEPPADAEYDDQDAFWLARPTLAHIRTTARTHLVSPWATLAGVLAHICTHIGPHVVLPDIIGVHASLNTFWALVGGSGAGKDSALAVAATLLALDENIPTHEVGTGQGIDSAYTVTTTAGPIQFCDSALFTATEIDTLGGHAGMVGSTLLATLRKVYTGSALGARYADRTRRRPVRAHHYRAALVAGVQPARSKVLLADHTAGTPQRWLWLPTNDPGAPLGPPPPRQTLNGGAAASTGWRRHDLWQADPRLCAHGGNENENDPVPHPTRIVLSVCDPATEAMITARQARLHAPLTAEDPDTDLASHALLTQLKVAALLAVFDGSRTHVDEQDWALAATICHMSTATRELCARTLAEANRTANAAQAHAAVDRDDIATERALQRVAAALQRVLRRRDDWVGRAALRRDLPGRDREYFDAALARLHSAGQIDRDETDRGEKYRARDVDR